MAILNQDLDWSRIALNPNIRRAFRGAPVKTQIPPGTVLCRFITTESKKNGIRGNEIFFSPWWMDWNTTASMLAQWKTVKTPTRDVIRGMLGVSTEMNQELDGLVQIILTKPAFAWRGSAHYQDDNVRKVTYLGGGKQFYLPNLASDAQGLSSGVAYMHCFTSVEALE